MLIRTAKIVFNKTLNSVIFGVALMVLLALYIAIGSGIPGVREHFEMNELQFFGAWPLKVLMALLVMNLIVVTWTRIPLTPPRYGVWMIHLGIITLIVGMGGYYWNKIEGQVKIPLGAQVEHFYDAAERSLYVKLNNDVVDTIPLDNLPRFKEYGVEKLNVEKLDKTGLRDIQPAMTVKDADTGRSKVISLSDAYGWKDKLQIDVLGYWPYAAISTSFATDPNSTDVGLRLAMADPHSGKQQETWLMGSDARHKQRQIAGGNIEVEHRHQDNGEIVEGLKKAATQLLQLSFAAGDKKGDTFVEVGKAYKLGETGYEITVESFNPNWPMFGTGEMVRAMTMMVKSPTMQYRRMILEGKPVQTDFKLDEEGAGPMGKRQKEPLDKALSLSFATTDPFRLLPQDATTKHTFLTTGDGKLVDLLVSLEGKSSVTEYPTGRAAIEIIIDETPPRGPFQPPPTPEELAEAAAHRHPVTLNVARVDKIVKDDQVIAIPSAQRDRDIGASGFMQVIRAKVTMGQWSKVVLVPFTPEAAESHAQWTSPTFKLLGSESTMQLALCNTRFRLPAKLTLANFELVPYPGGDPNSPRALIRDFRSTLLVDDPRTQTSETAVAHMNNPVYFDGGRWLFFQAAYDGENKAWTILGVGNRPCVWIMTVGCVMIFVGLMYAFYLKPIIIRRMKQNAIAAAEAKKKAKATAETPEPEPALV